MSFTTLVCSWEQAVPLLSFTNGRLFLIFLVWCTDLIMSKLLRETFFGHNTR